MRLPLVLAATAVVPHWAAIGVSGSDLRVFVDRASISRTVNLRRAVVRIGAPTAIAGPIVLVYQTEDFACRTKQCRLVSFVARDGDNKVVGRSRPGDALQPFVTARTGTIGDAVLAAVCGAD